MRIILSILLSITLMACNVGKEDNVAYEIQREKGSDELSEYMKICQEGIDKYNLEDYNGAIQDYTKAIELSPLWSAAYDYRGIAKSELKDYIGAIQDFNKAIELHPYGAIPI